MEPACENGPCAAWQSRTTPSEPMTLSRPQPPCTRCGAHPHPLPQNLDLRVFAKNVSDAASLARPIRRHAVLVVCANADATLRCPCTGGKCLVLTKKVFQETITDITRYKIVVETSERRKTRVPPMKTMQSFIHIQKQIRLS